MDNSQQIIDRSQLVDYFKQGESSPENCKVGLECEVFIVDKETLELVPYYGDRGIEKILKEVAANFNWEPVLEKLHIIGLSDKTANVTMEPAGQLELSGTACMHLKDCITEYNKFITELKSVCEPLGVGLLPLGYQPLNTLENTAWVPKGRYKILSKYFADYGGHLAHHMMKLTATVQASIDYCSEDDFREKMLLASYLVPVLYAIYANSPLKQNKFSGYLSYRGHIWEHTDDDRCGIVPAPFKKSFSYDDYVEYLLNVPMVLRIAGNEVIPMHGITFKEYLKKENATMADWEMHTSFAFPEVRVKNYIEIRSCDCQKPELVPTIPALIKGLFYCPKTRHNTLSLFEGISFEEIVALKNKVTKTGLQTVFKGRKVLELAQEIYKIAQNCLKDFAEEGKVANSNDLKYLSPLEEYLFDKKCSPAEELLNLWEKNGQDILKIRDKILI
ncbi:MAG: glutamate--cysteine ligase [Clostridiales bacterium]|jgi:glutamate--cysteine ligase|nr:glutamate--cysteine ligase [Clostridiales bacterium]